jgi:CheY-like chemotaxis protein
MKNILVIDDNVSTTDLVKLILETSGYGCSVANNAEDGFKKICNNDYDFILLDLAMPIHTGKDLLEWIKKEDSCNRQKILLFTVSPGPTDEELSEMINKYPIIGKISKPFTKNQLINTIKEFSNGNN